jgi:hypothetical protein
MRLIPSLTAGRFPARVSGQAAGGARDHGHTHHDRQVVLVHDLQLRQRIDGNLLAAVLTWRAAEGTAERLGK